jgi:hypothetical protein
MTTSRTTHTDNYHLPFTYEIARAEIDARSRRAERRRGLAAGRRIRTRSDRRGNSGGAA